VPYALIVGAFGQDNPGDEALLASAVDAVRSCDGWQPVVATARRAATADRLDVDTVPATAVGVGRAATRCDALVVGGGTIFKELHATSRRGPSSLLANTAVLCRVVQGRNRPVALLGVGASSMRTRRARALARDVAEHVDLLVLRDSQSAEVLVALGVPGPLRVGADLTWTSLRELVPQPRTDEGPLGVAVSHLAGDDAFDLRLGTAIAVVAGSHGDVEVEPWQGSPHLGPDARCGARLAKSIGRAARVVDPPLDLADAVARSSRRSGIVAMRFHGAVAAAMAGRPFLAVAHEPKLAGLAARLGQPSVPPTSSIPALVAGLEALAGAGPPHAELLAVEAERSHASVDLLRLLLSGRGSSRRLTKLELVPEPVPA
jgi:hypothetical protein